MTRAIPHLPSTVVDGPTWSTDTAGRRHHVPGLDPDELEPYNVWPGAGEGAHVHKWHDAKQRAERFEADQQRLFDELLPRSIELGDDVDDPGALSRCHAHRIAESAVARAKLKRAVPLARELGRHDDADRLERHAYAMLACRQKGPVGFNSDGEPIIAWEEKCGLAKYCPDEARKDSKRIGEVCIPEIQAHATRGGRVYKAFLTLSNYPGDRLEEGCRHAFSRWSRKIWRPQSKGQNKFGITGALLILEAPLGKQRDWNIHLNVILLTDRWLDFRAFQEAWGAGMKIRQHNDYSDAGMAGLFNELIKYATRALPEKSADDQHDAPAMCDWTGAELLEWDCAMHGLRRTRTYGKLYGLGKPDHDPSFPRTWLAYIHHEPSGYVVTRRAHDLAMHRDLLLRHDHFDLFLIRGDKSTTRCTPNYPTGPP